MVRPSTLTPMGALGDEESRRIVPSNICASDRGCARMAPAGSSRGPVDQDYTAPVGARSRGVAVLETSSAGRRCETRRSVLRRGERHPDLPTGASLGLDTAAPIARQGAHSAVSEQRPLVGGVDDVTWRQRLCRADGNCAAVLDPVEVHGPAVPVPKQVLQRRVGGMRARVAPGSLTRSQRTSNIFAQTGLRPDRPRARRTAPSASTPVSQCSRKRFLQHVR